MTEVYKEVTTFVGQFEQRFVPFNELKWLEITSNF